MREKELLVPRATKETHVLRKDIGYIGNTGWNNHGLLRAAVARRPACQIG